MLMNYIDLRSDTVTLPTPAMLEAICSARLGDDTYDEDPTVQEFERLAAELVGKEAAVLLPSGTMCNNIAILVQCRPGDEIVCDASAHVVNLEGGAPAALGTPYIRGQRGI